MRYLYTVLFYLIQPIIWLRLLWRSRKAPDYRRRWQERYGFCKGKVVPNGILVHSVSVGETIAAIPLIKALQKNYPDFPITVTTMTPTGSQQVKKSFSNSVSHVYLPYDLPCSIRRFLTILKPKLVIVLETELWPNLITILNQRKIPLIVANARLSERSAAGYAKLGKTIQTFLSKITYIAAQNSFDGERFLQLGISPNQLSVTGSIKFDISLTNEQLQAITELKSTWQLNRPVWIAASTHQGEDDLLLTVHKMLLKTYPDLLLIIVPRHPERFNDVALLIKAHQLNYQLRSQNQIPSSSTKVVLGDTMGELWLLYALADIAFVGGSFVEHGGHNPLEPALHGLPIITGLHCFNFKVICQQLKDQNGIFIIPPTADDLYQTLNKLIPDQEQRKKVGNSAFNVLKQNQGALERLLRIIEMTLPR